MLESFLNKDQDLQACNFLKKRLQHRCFPVNIAKIFKNSFFIEHLRWLLLQVLYKKTVPKQFARFTRTYRYRSPFLSSCWLITCNFVKIVVPGRRVSEFCEISQNNFVQNRSSHRRCSVKKRCS